MGKSPNSCFKIISCGSDSKDIEDDLSPLESKQPSDKRRWSFRKRSARHQVPSNVGISEPQFVNFDKENLETTPDKMYSVKDLSVPDKPPLIEQANVSAPLSVDNSEKKTFIDQRDKTTPVSADIISPDSTPVVELPPYSEVENVEHTSEITTSMDADFWEKDIIIIQAAARRFLVRKEVHKLKNIVKLQAAVRGHLVRRQAIGTLRCVQAIVKMQALVRARCVNQCQEKNDDMYQTDLVQKNPDMRSNQTKSTLEKLLSNGFARQLQESTSKTKPIHVSCDPLKHDTAWQWLERWMSVTSSKIHQQQELKLMQNYQVVEDNGSNFSPRKLDEGSETDNFNKFESQTQSIDKDQCFGSSAELYKEQFQNEEQISMKEENFAETIRDNEYSDSGTETITENLTQSTNIATSDPIETVSKKFDLGSRKIRNPAFAAVQAKFEELSSAPKASKSISIFQHASFESKPNQSNVVGSMPITKDISSSGNSSTHNPIVQAAASECGTEISISSTLDSPDRSETDGGEIVLEIGASGEAKHIVNNNGTFESSNLNNMKADENIRYPASDEYDEYAPPVKDSEKIVKSDLLINENQKENMNSQAMMSPERSPRNHATVSELHGTPSSQISMTPSSQISVQSKSSNTENNTCARKSKSKSNSKNNLDEKSNKRSSFGMAAKLDNEPRCSTSTSSSLPNYMQATESARAKAHGGVSLKSSPDVHEKKDNQIKKRHSLPIGDEKQDSSPRVQRSTSQTHQSLKNNNNHSPHSSAERRWQR